MRLDTDACSTRNGIRKRLDPDGSSAVPMREGSRAESVTVLNKSGHKIATLSIVADGQHLMLKLDRKTLLNLLESGFRALRRQDR